jgi:tetratricopeptide (TPR) repeat protein
MAPTRLFRRGRLAAACLLAALLAACAAPPTPKDGDPPPAEEKPPSEQMAFYEESAQTYYDGGRYQQSVLMWRRVLEIDPTRQKARWGLAKSLSMVGTPAALRESMQIFSEIVDLDWSHPTLGDRRHEVLKDYAEVFTQLADYYERDVVALQKKLDQPGADQATLRRQIADQGARRDDLLRRAIPTYQQVLALSPDNPYALAGLAKAHLMAGQDAQGIGYARRYVELSVRSQREWEAQLKKYEEQREGQVTDEQRKYFQDRIRGAREKESRVRILLGAVLMRNRDPRGAIVEYDRVLELDASQLAAYVERAQAYAAVGDYRRAIKDLETYLKVSDPVEMRPARIRAAELMDEYRLKAAAEPRTPAPGAPPPATAPGTGAFPPPAQPGGGFPPPAPPPSAPPRSPGTR